MKRSFLTQIFDLIAPRHCVVCGRRLTIYEDVVCGRCYLDMPLTRFHRSPLDNEMARLFWGQVPIERVGALFFYAPHSGMAHAIHALKYADRPDVGLCLGRVLATHYQPSGFFQGIDAIIPVPLSQRRKHHRGYNQSAVIAHGIAEATGLPVWDKLVRRTTFAISQTSLNLWERRNNTQSVFQLTDEEKIRGCHVLIVDDVVTTGSTIIALISELQKAGNVTFSVLSLGFTKH